VFGPGLCFGAFFHSTILRGCCCVV
jgi:hypothetical protein